LDGLVDQLATKDGRKRTIALLRAVGSRVAAATKPGDEPQARVAAAAEVLRELGGDVEVQHTETGWMLQGFGCPLSAVTSRHPEACALATAVVEDITGGAVTECCERGERPRCAFRIDYASAGKPRTARGQGRPRA